jgi:uncharacterized membrane protein YeiH
VFVALNGLVDSNLLRFLVLLTVFGLRLAAIWWKIHLPAFEPSVNIHQG